MLAARLNDVAWERLVPPALQVDKLRGNDDELIAEALRDEYALIYGMGVAAARVPDSLRESTVTSAERHRSLRDSAVQMLTDAGADVPAAGGGYVADPDVADIDGDAAGFASALEAAAASSWRRVVTEAKDPKVRLFAMCASGLSNAGAAVFTGEPEVALPGLTG
nr:DUF4439 domain-containing protein [Corynebacterium sp. TAE3-ERU12]